MRAFAEKIVTAVASSRSISLDVRSLSPLSAAEVSAIQQQLQSVLGTAGISTASGSAAETQVQVTLSRGSEGYLWVAEIHGRPGDQTLLMSAQPANAPSPAPKHLPILRQKLLLVQPEPILDFALLQAPPPESAPRLLALYPDRVDLLTQQNGVWTKHDSAPIEHSGPWPRDLRGRIVVSESGDFKIVLPGTICSGALLPKISLECRQAEAPWSQGAKGEPKAEARAESLIAARNYFAAYGDMTEPQSPPFYSMASNADRDRSRTILAELDGAAQLLDNSRHPLATFSGWGDEIASVTGCDDAWNVLATGAGDWTSPDHVQVYAIDEDRQATPAGQPLEFLGPLMALWPSEDGQSARAVSFNLQTGMYDASIIAISCGN